jgi:hypothetical protein
MLMNNEELIFRELRHIKDDLDYIKRVMSMLDVEDLVLRGDEEDMIEETLEQKERGELLKWEEVFGE